MRIEVKTRKNVRVHLDLSRVTSQTEVTTDEGVHYLVHMEGGQTLDLSSRLPDIATQEKDLRKKARQKTFLDRLAEAQHFVGTGSGKEEI